MAQYGEVRVDFITYTTGVSPNEGNVTVPVSGLINSPTFSGNLIVEGSGIFQENVSISGNLTVSGTSNFSGIVTTATGVNVGGDLAVTGDISGNANGGVYGNNYWKIPDGTTAQRPGEAGMPPAVTGMIRYNTTNDEFEGWDGSWGQLGGGATGASGDKVFILNETGVNHNYTLTGFNAVSAGAITIDDGVNVTIADTFGWSIV